MACLLVSFNFGALACCEAYRIFMLFWFTFLHSRGGLLWFLLRVFLSLHALHSDSLCALLLLSASLSICFLLISHVAYPASLVSSFSSRLDGFFLSFYCSLHLVLCVLSVAAPSLATLFFFSASRLLRLPCLVSSSSRNPFFLSASSLLWRFRAACVLFLFSYRINCFSFLFLHVLRLLSASLCRGSSFLHSLTVSRPSYTRLFAGWLAFFLFPTQPFSSWFTSLFFVSAAFLRSLFVVYMNFVIFLGCPFILKTIPSLSIKFLLKFSSLGFSECYLYDCRMSYIFLLLFYLIFVCWTYSSFISDFRNVSCTSLIFLLFFVFLS